MGLGIEVRSEKIFVVAVVSSPKKNTVPRWGIIVNFRQFPSCLSYIQLSAVNQHNDGKITGCGVLLRMS